MFLDAYFLDVSTKFQFKKFFLNFLEITVLKIIVKRSINTYVPNK